MRSRAAYKLMEIDDRAHFLRKGARVVDLGAAPGGWSQIAAQRVGVLTNEGGRLRDGQASATPSPLVGEGRGGGSRDYGAEVPHGPTPDPASAESRHSEGSATQQSDRSRQQPTLVGGGEESAVPAQRKRTAGRVVAIDLLDMPAIPGVEFLRLDFLDAAAPDRLKALLNGPADVVLSDMAPNATGHRKTDHLRIMALAEAAAMFAREVLRPGGAFLCKVLQGGAEAELLAGLKRDFATVKHVKPAASRSDSAELYVLALGFRGAGGDDREKI
jgi:23S rRNA U2552 (ribose-2'-O)-methylase RlmE/FtsJ